MLISIQPQYSIQYKSLTFSVFVQNYTRKTQRSSRQNIFYGFLTEGHAQM